jgi:hypothetical protein
VRHAVHDRVTNFYAFAKLARDLRQGCIVEVIRANAHGGAERSRFIDPFDLRYDLLFLAIPDRVLPV